MPSISAVLIVRNAASTVRRCLESIIDVVDEIVVVDGYSSDGTQRICREYTDKIFLRTPKGIADLDRNFALSKAKGDWILYIDADEYISKELHDSVGDLVKRKEIHGFAFPRINYSFSRPILHGFFYPDYQIRLYQKAGVHYHGRIHELPQIQGKILKANLHIIHKNPDASKIFPKKMISYAIIFAHQTSRSKSRRFYIVKGMMRSIRIFILYYIIKDGHLDGIPGLLSHIQISLYLLCEYWFLALLGKRN